jgi:hypothetical protein
MRRRQLFDLSRGGAEQIGWIMSRADELPHAIRVQQKEKERDELEGKRFFAKQPVDPVQDFRRLRPRAEFHAESAQHHRTQQGRGIPLPETSARTPIHSPELSCRKS